MPNTIFSLLCEARFGHALTTEMFETFPSGGSIHASAKLEGIDGRAPQERVGRLHWTEAWPRGCVDR